MSRLTVHALAALSIVIGVGSLIVFTIFLYTGPFNSTNLGLGIAGALVLDASLCLVFFFQHSGMIRKSAKRCMSQVISEQDLGAVFSIASGITLLALVLLWQETALVLASAGGFYRWSFRAVFFLAIAGQVWGIWSLKSADLFGTESVLRRSGPTPPPAPMVVRGPYRWVRHPLYLTTLLMIWSYPDLTADRLLFSVLFTAWIIVGTVLEERDLVADYGEVYRNYQRAVPMLVPYRRPIDPTTG
jgi:protein-S-isoprenylcysteine O-methyltransferase Ste14